MSVFDDIKAKHGAGPDYARKADFTTIYGYSKGKCLGTFPDAAAANAAGASTTEKNLDDDAYKAAEKAYRDHAQAITDEWHATMRAECPFNDETWNAIYSAAYERGHSYGMSEVEIHLSDYTDFARKVIEANK